MAGAGWERVQCYIDYALNVTDINRVVLGISPSALPISTCKATLPEIDNFSEFNLLFSMKAFDASINTMLSQHKSRSSHTRDGMYFYIRGLSGIDNQFREFYRNFEKLNNCNLKQFIETDSYKVTLDEVMPETASNLDISGLLNVVKLVNSKNIKLRIYIYPSHAIWQEMQIMCGNYKSYWSNLSYIVREVEKLGGDVEIWDFNQFNKYSTEEITNQSALYWQDPEHFNYEYGELMLDAMFGNESKAPFGVLLTSKSMKQSYQEYIVSRNNYLKANNQFISSIDKLLY